MKINSDINVLGSLPDLNLIKVFMNESMQSLNQNGGYHSYTSIKTDKSVKRFENAIKATLLGFRNKEVELLFKSTVTAESISSDSLLIIFWNASFNNELLNHLNVKVFFPAFYSGRVTIKNDEIIACFNELKESENDLKKWSESTINITASKYLTFLKKFGLMEGSVNKSILHPHLSDKLFVLFVYWLLSIESVSNILNSNWLQYSFSEKNIFIERVLQKKYSKFFNILFTGDRMKIEPLISYKEIYNAVTKS